MPSLMQQESTETALQRCFEAIQEAHEALLRAKIVQKEESRRHQAESHFAIDDDQLFSDVQVSEIIGRSRSALQRDRIEGRGVPFVRVGGQVRYRGAVLKQYIASLSTYRSTSEPVADDGAGS